MQSKEFNSWKAAWSYFWPEGNGNAKSGYVLHHKDPSWKTKDPDRYAQWNVEDLVMLTISDHVKLHELGKMKTDEHKLNLSISHLGQTPWNKGKRGISEETRRKLSEAHKGKTTWMKGKKHTEEAKEKNRQAHLGRIPWNKDKEAEKQPVEEDPAKK